MAFLVIIDNDVPKENVKVLQEVTGDVTVVYVDEGSNSHQYHTFQAPAQRPGDEDDDEDLLGLQVTLADTPAEEREKVGFLDNFADRALRKALVKALMRKSGKSEAEVLEKVAEVEADSGRPLLDWLKNGGLEGILKLILLLLSGI